MSPCCFVTEGISAVSTKLYAPRDITKVPCPTASSEREALLGALAAGQIQGYEGMLHVGVFTPRFLNVAWRSYIWHKTLCLFNNSLTISTYQSPSWAADSQQLPNKLQKQVGCTRDFYSGSPGFKFCPKHRLSWYVFDNFYLLQKSMLQQCLKIRHRLFPSSPFQFVVH